MSTETPPEEPLDKDALLPLARLLAGKLRLEEDTDLLADPAPSASWNDIPTLHLDEGD